MTESKCTVDADDRTAGRPAAAQFKPFEWNPLEELRGERRRYAAFLNDARDVMDGAHTLMGLLLWDEQQGEGTTASDAFKPVLDGVQRASLQRLLIATIGMLHMSIEKECE